MCTNLQENNPDEKSRFCFLKDLKNQLACGFVRKILGQKKTTKKQKNKKNITNFVCKCNSVRSTNKTCKCHDCHKMITACTGATWGESNMNMYKQTKAVKWANVLNTRTTQLPSFYSSWQWLKGGICKASEDFISRGATERARKPLVYGPRYCTNKKQ